MALLEIRQWSNTAADVNVRYNSFYCIRHMGILTIEFRPSEIERER